MTRRLGWLRAAVPALLLLGTAVAMGRCGDGATGELPYDVLCPMAGTECAHATGPLLVGMAKRDITPTITEIFCDCGADGLCPEAGPLGLCRTAGYPGPDAGEYNAELDGHPTVVNGPENVHDADDDGYFDAVWIAGYGNGRPAQGVHDPLWARALVLRKGETTLALVAVDLVGYFYDEVERIRAALPASLGVDLLLVSATHTHEGPDSIGIWGYDEGTSGVDPAYMAFVRAQIAGTVADAVGALAEAKVAVAHGPAGVHPNPTVTAEVGINNILRDARDPVIMDHEMRVLRFTRAADHAPIGTLVNWQNHPESLCSRNAYVSSDFVHYLREAMENGVQRGPVNEPGLGGIAMYINGAVGGMQTPGNIQIIDLDGVTLTSTCETTTSADHPFFARARAFGELAGLDALRLLGEGGEALSNPPLSFATKIFRLPVENWGYHAMFLTEVFYGRHMYDFDRTRQITDDNLPKIQTEVAVLNLGPVQAITIPGELLPEWYVGGYDGSAVGPRQTLIDTWCNELPAAPRACTSDSDCAGAPLAEGRTCGASDCRCTNQVCLHRTYNPPDLSRAPGPPYLRDRMTRRIKLVLGLTPDELGYIVPGYDFELDARQPYVEEAPCDHYEETNSIGKAVGSAVEERLRALLGVVP